MKAILFLICLVVFASTLTISSKVNKQLLKTGSANIFINFDKQADFKSNEKKLKIKYDDMEEDIRGQLVVNELKALAFSEQKQVIEYLKEKKADYHSFWITNTIAVKNADLKLINELKQFKNLNEIELVGEAKIADGYNGKVTKRSTVEAGVKWVKADQVWAKGFKGKGIVYGVIDTGNFLHDDMKNTYRGRNGNHAENWLDTVNRRTEPYDDHFHGTHCGGTVGGSSSNLTVGVAPEAEWISCKFLSARGSGTWENGIKCMEFMLAPGGDSNKRPHIVSNSYGGGSPQTALHNAIKALLAAGVEMVFAAGNSGSRCSTVLYPAKYQEVFSVGSVNRNSDAISFFSSRGPGNNGQLKPEVVAPGASVVSCSNRGGYRTASGTSMACPHVAGALALLWNAKPTLKRKLEASRKVLQDTANAQESTLCSSEQKTPNNVYGYGTINTLKACA